MLGGMKILSWNVNGIRAAQRKGFLEWLAAEAPDILCVQETKCHVDQLDLGLVNPPGYHTVWNCAEKKGYSGVAIFSRQKPLGAEKGFGVSRFDCEGRAVMAEYSDFALLNIYFPNGQSRPERLQYKLDFYAETLKFVQRLKARGKRVIICGDYNTAHKPIDLARPKENEKVSGFLPVEREWLDAWVGDGQVDVFREFNREPGHYTWWDQISRARERNVGWRIDYHFVTDNLMPKVKGAGILPHIMGSDHCPVSLELLL